MTDSALASLFTILATFTLLLTVNTVSFIQGGPAFGESIAEAEAIAAYYGIFLCGVPLILTLLVVGVHASHRGQRNRWDRLALFWLSEKDHGPQDRSAPEVRLFLAAGIVIFLIAPIYGIGHMLDTVFEDGRIGNRAPEVETRIAPIDALPIFGANWSDPVMTTQHLGAVRLRYHALGKDDADVSIDWLRYATPAGFLAICLGILGSLGWVTLLLARPAAHRTHQTAIPADPQDRSVP